MKQEDSSHEWWCIDPDSSARLRNVGPGNDASGFYLGDAPLADVAMIATNIDASFGSSRYFTNDEARRLLEDRIVPSSIREHEEGARELLESVDSLWTLVNEHYRGKWGRDVKEVERCLIEAYALSVIRQK
jgi:hypothetical protein